MVTVIYKFSKVYSFCFDFNMYNAIMVLVDEVKGHVWANSLIKHLLNKRISYKCLLISYFYNQRKMWLNCFPKHSHNYTNADATNRYAQISHYESNSSLDPIMAKALWHRLVTIKNQSIFQITINRQQITI